MGMIPVSSAYIIDENHSPDLDLPTEDITHSVQDIWIDDDGTIYQESIQILFADGTCVHIVYEWYDFDNKQSLDNPTVKILWGRWDQPLRVILPIET